VPYRVDATAFSRERARMLARLWDLEARFTDVFWRELGPELAVSRSSPREWAGEPSEHDLVRLGERVSALEAVLARWPGIVRKWSKPATRAPRGEGSLEARARYLDAPLEVLVAREEIEVAMRECRPRFPIDVRVVPKGRGVQWTIASSAPRGAGTVGIEPERLLDDLRKMAGVLTDIEIGDDRFDGVFLISGHEATVRALLDLETRRTILRLGARSAGMRVALDHGEAWVQLQASPDRGLMEDVLAVLHRLRQAPVRALRRD
jgi:hypothetical protein